jgi:hypothetical protein
VTGSSHPSSPPAPWPIVPGPQAGPTFVSQKNHHIAAFETNIPAPPCPGPMSASQGPCRHTLRRLRPHGPSASRADTSIVRRWSSFPRKHDHLRECTVLHNAPSYGIMLGCVPVVSVLCTFLIGCLNPGLGAHGLLQPATELLLHCPQCNHLVGHFQASAARAFRVTIWTQHFIGLLVTIRATGSRCICGREVVSNSKRPGKHRPHFARRHPALLLHANPTYRIVIRFASILATFAIQWMSNLSASRFLFTYGKQGG